MQNVAIKSLVPGMVTAENIYSADHQLILPKNIVLTKNVILRLQSYPILAINIEDEILMLDTDSGITVTPSHFEAMRTHPDFLAFRSHFDNVAKTYRDCINDVVKRNAAFNIDALVSSVLSLAKTDCSFTILDMLQNMRDYDDSTYTHCINVALISRIFGSWLNLPSAETDLLTICGLLHDIGKLLIPAELIKKPGKLTPEEYKLVQSHTTEGYKLLGKMDIDPHIKNAALLHHEKYDGSGYPYGLKGDRTDSYAQVITIVDIYDAMTSARTYRPPICPFTVISNFEDEGLEKYNPKLILVFLEHIVNSYLQTRVELSNEKTGDIIYINKTNLSRPLVKCGNIFVDLSASCDLEITRVF